MNLTREDLEKVLRAMYDNVVASAHNNVSDAVQAGLDALGGLQDPEPSPGKKQARRLRFVDVGDLRPGDVLALNSGDAMVNEVQEVPSKGYVRVTFHGDRKPMAFLNNETVSIWR